MLPGLKRLFKLAMGEKMFLRLMAVKIYFVNIKRYRYFDYLQKYNTRIFSVKRANVFCGYYDLVPERCDKILAHKLAKRAKHSDSISIGYFLVGENNTFHEITKTYAWSWQQGSRLRWSNTEKGSIFYNVVQGDKYVTIKKNLDSNGEVVYDTAFYDISPDEKYGASINFDRLQRLRPGYGYSCFEDKTKKDNAPERDGLFLIELNSNKKKLVASLRSLAEDVDEGMQFEHYLNHISFSPNSKRVMFFHLWNEKRGRFSWQNRLCIYDIDSDKIKILESEAIVSHYAWIDNKKLLITCGTERGEEYRVYNIEDGSYNVIDHEQLKRDGHPVMIKKEKVFCSDTYPDKKSVQELFLYNFSLGKYTRVAQMYSDPLLYGEKRCDLHPKYVKSSNSILVDSTFSSHCRKIIRTELPE